MLITLTSLESGKCVLVNTDNIRMIHPGSNCSLVHMTGHGNELVVTESLGDIERLQDDKVYYILNNLLINTPITLRNP